MPDCIEPKPVSISTSQPLSRRRWILNITLIIAVFGVLIFGPTIVERILPWVWSPAEELGGGIIHKDTLTYARMDVTESHLRQAVRKQPQVKRLVFNHSSVTPEALALLDQFPKLAEIHFEGDHEVPLEAIPPLSSLNSLMLANGPRPDATQLRTLARFPKLRSLSLFATKVSDEDLSEVTKLSSLRSLTLYGEGITDASVPGILQMTGLSDLTIIQTSVSARGYCQLVARKHTIRLMIVAPELKPTLAEWFTLYRYVANDTPFAELAEVRAIQALPLTRRTIPMMSETTPLPEVLANIKMDESTGEYGCALQVDFVRCIPTSEALRLLESWKVPLILSWKPEEDIELLDQLQQMSHLRELHIEISSVDAAETVAKGWQPPASLESLSVSLSLSPAEGKSLDPHAVVSTMAPMSKLTALYFEVTEADLPLFKDHPTLRDLTLKVPQFTESMVANLRAIPRLDSLRVMAALPVTSQLAFDLLADRPGWKYLTIPLADPTDHLKLKKNFPWAKLYFVPTENQLPEGGTPPVIPRAGQAEP